MNNPISHADLSSDSSFSTRMSLIIQAQRDVPSAWELVFSLYTPLIRRWARGNGVRCPHELDNVTQEVFAKLHKSLRKYENRKSGGSFRGWLRRITRNHVYTNHFGEKMNVVKTIGGSEWHRMVNDCLLYTSDAADE